MTELCMQLQAKAADCISLIHQEANLFSFHLFWQPYVHKTKLHWQLHRLELQQLFWMVAEQRIQHWNYLWICESLRHQHAISTKILEWVKYSNYVNSLYGTDALMAQKKELGALDRTLKDLRGNEKPFGDGLILLSVDFRQTLPVIPCSTAADEINACLKSSVLLGHVQKLTLKSNMRAQLQHGTSAELFAKHLLDIGNGKVSIDESTHCITLPTSFCTITATKDELVQKFSEISHRIT